MLPTGHVSRNIGANDVIGFTQGRVGMTTRWFSYVPDSPRHLRRSAWCPIPKDPDQGTLCHGLGGFGMAISKTTRNLDAAWRFVAYAAGPAGAIEEAKLPGRTPARPFRWPGCQTVSSIRKSTSTFSCRPLLASYRSTGWISSVSSTANSMRSGIAKWAEDRRERDRKTHSGLSEGKPAVDGPMSATLRRLPRWVTHQLSVADAKDTRACALSKAYMVAFDTLFVCGSVITVKLCSASPKVRR